MAAPDKASLLEFTPKAAAEIKQNTFAATTGGLVNLSAPTFWEMYYAAQAWHQAMQRRSESLEAGFRQASKQRKKSQSATAT